MAGELYALRPKTAARLAQLLGDAGDGGDLPRPKPRGRTVTIVRCQSDVAAGGGGAGNISYPAKIIVDNSDDSTPTEVPGGDCWLTLWDDNDVPAIPTRGRLYVAVLSGELVIGSESRPRAFSVADCCDEDGPPSGWSGSGWSGFSGGSGGGDSDAPIVVLGPTLACLDGIHPVITGRVDPNGDVRDAAAADECCTDCDEGSSGSGSGSGTEGFCDTYVVNSTTLARSASKPSVWLGGDYVLKVRAVRLPGGSAHMWVLDARYGTGFPCVWTITDWDGTNCATFTAAHRIADCAATIEVCCSSGDAPDCTDVPPGGLGDLNLDADAGCVAYSLTASPSSNTWTWVPAAGHPIDAFFLRCVGGVYVLNVAWNDGPFSYSADYTPVSGTVSPFTLTFHVPAGIFCGTADTTPVDVVISE